MTLEQERRLLACVEIVSRVVRNLCQDERWTDEFKIMNQMIDDLGDLREER